MRIPTITPPPSFRTVVPMHGSSPRCEILTKDGNKPAIRPAIFVLASLLAAAGCGFAQTNPTALSLPVNQDFGTSTFTTMPAGFAAWNGLNGNSITNQALAEASVPTGNATITAATTAQTGGGTYGYAVSGNARPYIQTSSNATNGVNQVAMALDCTNWQDVVVQYRVEIISPQSKTVGVVCQYRLGTSGAWTTLTPTAGSNPYSQAGGTAGVKAIVSATLPAAANNQPVVQIRWATWRGTEAGSSSGLAIDNVVVNGSPFVDSTPPTIGSYTPANNATGVAATTNLVAQFSETVVKGAGDITVKLVSDNSPVFTIPVTDAAVNVSANTATITLPSSLSGLTGYYVNIAPGAFEDLAGNDFAGIADNATWTFTTADIDATPPAITALTPADDSSTSAATANLVITYDEPVFANSGSLTIRQLADNSTVETVPVPGALVSISGTMVTVNPSSILQYGTAYYVEIAADTFRDAANNGTIAVTGNSTWNFTTRNVPSVVISQYYEGTASADRFIELRNLTGSPLPLTGYRIAAWSDTAPSDNEGWKSGTNTTPRVTDLSAFTIPANGHLLISEPSSTTPAYAANNFDVETDAVNPSATDFDGDDSVVLYNGPGFTQAEIVDALPVSAVQAANTSIYRLSNTLQGYDLNSGTSFLNFPGTWATKTLAEVNNAALTDDWYLQAAFPPLTLTLDIDPTSFSEAAGNGTATATVTRSGPTTEALLVTIGIDGTKATTGDTVLDIPIGQSSAQFSINAIDDAWLLGDATVTFNVSAPGFVPDSGQVTVLDQETDAAYPVVINEVDADQAGTDAVEFVELYNNSGSTVSLDGFVLVFYNGDAVGDPSYRVVDLTGHSISANDFFVIGSEFVANVDLVAWTTNGVQNGPDGIGLYYGEAADFPTGTLPTAAPGLLVDALVYSNTLTVDSNLVNALTPGEPQVDENLGANGAVNSMSRSPDGGAALDTSVYVMQVPTPGATNVLPVDDFAAWIAGYDVDGLTGFNDDFDGDGLDNALENIFGSDPSVSNQGLSAVSSSGGNLVFRHTLNDTPASDLVAGYEWSVNLVDWNADGAASGGTTVTFGEPVEINAGPPALVEVTATVDGTPPARVFARLKVTQTP